jgi:hypothetical protein
MTQSLEYLKRGRERATEPEFVQLLRDSATCAQQGFGPSGMVILPVPFVLELADELEFWTDEVQSARAKRDTAAVDVRFAKAWMRKACLFMLIQMIALLLVPMSSWSQLGRWLLP